MVEQNTLLAKNNHSSASNGRGKNILFVKPPFRGGTFYFRTAQYIDFFRRNGHGVNVLYPAPDSASVAEKLPLQQITAKVFFSLSHFGRYLVDLTRCDLAVLFPTPIISLYFLLAKAFRKRVLIEHYVSYLSHRDIFPKYPLFLDRWVYRKADFVLTHTETMKRELVKLLQLRQEHVLVAYCDVDLHHFSPRYKEETENLKRELGIQGRKVVFYHGLHHLWHGLDLIIEAAKIIERQRSDIVFVLLPGNYDQTKREGNIIHLAEKEHYSWETLPLYIQIGDLWLSGFKIHDRGERSFGSTLIQALAMARPIITAPGNEKSKFLEDDQNIFYVKPNSAEAIANKIIECFDDPVKTSTVGLNARKTAEQFFSIDHFDQTLDYAVASPPHIGPDIFKRFLRGIWLRIQNPFILSTASKKLGAQGYLKEAGYSQYLKEQLRHTVGLRTKDASFRYNKLISEFLKSAPNVDRNAKVLCVGCRNIHELNAFKSEGFRNVVGVDLFSTDPEILIMDMHDLKFPDNSFDILYSAATFEKAYDPKKVANEFMRVLKDGGYLILQVGAHFKPGEVDRHDFESLINLYEFFESRVDKIYFEEDAEHSLATIFQVAKKLKLSDMRYSDIISFDEIAKFELYADTHPCSDPVSDFERDFYSGYLTNFSGSILDIGCGDGKHAEYFRSQCPRSLIVPFDISSKRIKRVSASGFCGIVGTANRLPFDGGSFDRVFLMQVIEHVKSYEGVIKECRRILKSNGHLFITTPNYPIKRLYDWISMVRFGKWKKLRDDPTHCVKFSPRTLKKLLS